VENKIEVFFPAGNVPAKAILAVELWLAGNSRAAIPQIWVVAALESCAQQITPVVFLSSRAATTSQAPRQNSTELIPISLFGKISHHIDELVAEIESEPTLFRIFRAPQARRHFRRPFPYAVVYVAKPDHVWVLAVMHFKQPPTYWLHRLTN
jgi:hypothetical protein